MDSGERVEERFGSARLAVEKGRDAPIEGWPSLSKLAAGKTGVVKEIGRNVEVG